MTKWLVDNYPQVADIPNANGDLPVHFAAAQGEIALESGMTIGYILVLPAWLFLLT